MTVCVAETTDRKRLAMVNSNKRLARQTEDQAGPLAKVSVWDSKSGMRRVQIRCRECRHNPSGSAWTTRSDGKDKGQGSTVIFALDLWANHLDKRHPDETCQWSTSPYRGRALAQHEEERAKFWRDLGFESA